MTTPPSHPTTVPSQTAFPPLTTIFTPPPRCNFLNLTVEDPGYETVGESFIPLAATLAYQNYNWYSDPYYLHYYSSKTELSSTCYPSGYLSLGNTAWPVEEIRSMSYNRVLAFSPGLFCPVGWTSITRPTESYTAGYDATALDMELTAYCCPSGLGINTTSIDGPCIGPGSTTYSIESVLVATFGFLRDSATIQMYTAVTTQAPTIFQPATIVHPKIELIYKRMDLSLTTAQRTSAPTDGGNGTAGATTGGLSTGAKVGIGAGVGAVALLVLGAAIFFFLKAKRRKAAQDHGIATEKSNEAYNKPELEAKYGVDGTHAQPQHLEASASMRNPAHELYTMPHELGTYYDERALEHQESRAKTPTAGVSPSRIAPVAAVAAADDRSSQDRTAMRERELDGLAREEAKIRARKARQLEIQYLEQEEERIRARRARLEDSDHAI